MRTIKIIILAICFPVLIAATSIHKFYVSTTMIEYVAEKQSLQIITRIFIDDFERVLQERYDETIILSEKGESEIIQAHIERYLKLRINIKINDIDSKLVFLGKEYEDDMMICYLEINNVTHIKSLEISNSVLFDLNSDQQNIIRTKVNSKNKSFILIKENDKGLLKF
jgi:hypothetical protein